MKKKILAGLFMALCSLTASAQFEAKKVYIDASFSGLGLSYSKQDKLRFDIDATAGYFVARDFLLYGKFGLDQKRITVEKLNKYYKYVETDEFLTELNIGIGGRYYIEQNGIYLGLGFDYGHIEDSKKNYDNFYLTPEVGYAFFLNQYLTIQPSLYYSICLNDFANASKIGLKVGFGFYF